MIFDRALGFGCGRLLITSPHERSVRCSGNETPCEIHRNDQGLCCASPIHFFIAQPHGWRQQNSAHSCNCTQSSTNRERPFCSCRSNYGVIQRVRYSIRGESRSSEVLRWAHAESPGKAGDGPHADYSHSRSICHHETGSFVCQVHANSTGQSGRCPSKKLVRGSIRL